MASCSRSPGTEAGDPTRIPTADDKPLFTISAANVEQYRKQLSAGQIALLQKHPTWQMNVYPTRRSAAFPQPVYAETAANAGAAKLAPGGNGVTGTKGGIPFPAPKDGLEAIWNTMLRYRGDTYATRWRQAAVTRGGAYTPVDFDYEFDFNYGNLGKPARDRDDNRLAYVLQTITGPARLAGRMLLVDEPVDHAAQMRSAWAYDPGQRRVRPAPSVDYDNPGTAADALRTSDDFQMYNGATDRYEWKLVGRQELYIPYNSYRISGSEPTTADLLRAGHVNPDYARYELHRVWVVEATLKPGASHIYAKRVFYIDEDSWMIAVTDIVRHAWRAVAGGRAALDQLLRRADALRDGRGAHRPQVGALSGDGPAQRRAQVLHEHQARSGGLHAGRAARAGGSVSR